MSKRLMRIKAADIPLRLLNLEGHGVNAVLENGKTFFGTLVSATHEFVTLVDSRDYHHKLDVRGIYEIIYDYQSE